MNLSDVVYSFKHFVGLSISSGAHNKRHITSLISHRLSVYLFFIYGLHFSEMLTHLESKDINADKVLPNRMLNDKRNLLQKKSEFPLELFHQANLDNPVKDSDITTSVSDIHKLWRNTLLDSPNNIKDVKISDGEDKSYTHPIKKKSLKQKGYTTLSNLNFNIQSCKTFIVIIIYIQKSQKKITSN